MKNLDIKIVVVIVLSYLLLSFVTTSIDDFFMPGSQPLQSGTFKSPNQCDNCHGGYDNNAEPAFTWRGSMMAHAMRDPLYLASLTIANQDAVDAGDLCIRCHSPSGWLEGRSVPTDASNIMSNSIDMEGVHCHFCHKMMDPFSTDPDDINYMNTTLTLPNNVPTQHGNGMFVVDSEDIRRGPYSDLSPNHAFKYDSFYKESEMCASCHDVSNPVFTKSPDGTYQPNELGAAIPSDFDKYKMFPVERTYSEWFMSAYNSPDGIPSAVFGGNKTNVATCQDCHMPDVTGKGANKNGVPIRTDLGQHDMTGGNTFVPKIIKANYGNDVDAEAIDAGILRAEYMLQNAASMYLNVVPVGNNYQAIVEIVNETGHKLPSGYPEGRRMWINLEAYDINDDVIWESGAYNEITAELEKTGTKIYECKLGMSSSVAEAANSTANNPYGYTAGESFHFALNNEVIKDNRIPPRGFTNANFAEVQAAPVGYSYEDGAYFDKTTYNNLPAQTIKVEAKLYYQTVSKEYIEFLRDYNFTNELGNNLYADWVLHGMSEPELMNEAEYNIQGDAVTVVSSQDGNWSDTETWEGDYVPRSIDNVLINHLVKVNVDATINEVEISDGSQLVVDKTKSLIVNGNLNVINNNFILESDSKSFSSLILNGTISGNVLYKRYVNAFNESNLGGNDLISAPVVGQIFGDFATANPNLYENPMDGFSTQKLFGPFNKVDDWYQIYDLSDAEDIAVILDSGIGYRAARDASEDGTSGTTFTFSGSVNAGPVDIDILQLGDAYPEWNLIGNPYPSYIRLDEFLAVNNDFLEDNSAGVYGYNGNSNGWEIWNLIYSEVNPGKLIAPGQGFFVASKIGGSTIGFTPNMRSIGNSDDFIANKNTNISHLQLEVKSNTEKYVTDFYFSDNASLGLDPGFDASVFGDIAPDFAIYSQLVNNNQGIDMAIQSVSNIDLNNSIIIPLGINANQSQQLTVRIEESSLPVNTFVYLEDNSNNSWTLLNTDDYIFTPTSNLSGIGRFFLHFQTDSLSAFDVENDYLQILINQDSKSLIVKGMLQSVSRLILYDINGRIILNKQFSAKSTVNTIDVSNLKTGIYIVKLENKNQHKTKKVIIQ